MEMFHHQTLTFKGTAKFLQGEMRDWQLSPERGGFLLEQGVIRRSRGDRGLNNDKTTLNWIWGGITKGGIP